MSTNDNSSIQRQKSDVFHPENAVKLRGSCTLNNGILRLSEEEMWELSEVFDRRSESTTFFVPASGSGSRMFSELMKFVQDKTETPEIKAFFEKLPELALFSEFPLVIRQKINSLQSEYIAEYIVSEDGMNFMDKPKGLIPFHVEESRVMNPFQDQVLQALEILGENGKIHFTVQNGVEEKVLDAISRLQIENISDIVSFSNQDEMTNAYCFKDDGEVVSENGIPLRRPAGHGALLGNLNDLEEDLVLVKNIDNIQHSSKSGLNKKVWKYCAGLLLEFKQELKELVEDFSEDGLKELNAKYQFLSKEEEEVCNWERIHSYSLRPTRVCGMVVNEGAPGGGPFWMEENGAVTKQIVEKVQISDDDKDIMEESSHFNPVFIALSKTDCNGNPLNLHDFVDNSKYLVVNKPHKSEDIKFRELPGLWNGSMSNWNTIFLEIPKEVFSPVKSIFDLMGDAHQA